MKVVRLNENDIEKLNKIPLGSSLETKVEKLREIYENNQENKLLQEDTLYSD
jgi:ASC-1-like (ASCH) protein